MIEFFQFLVRFPVILLGIAIVAAFLGSEDGLKMISEFYTWLIFCQEDGFPFRIVVALILWIGSATALYCYLKFGHFDSNFWNSIMGVANIHHIKGA